MRLDIKEIADKADMIVNGYAFTRDGEYIRVLNLDYLNHAAVILNDRVVETNITDLKYVVITFITLQAVSLRQCMYMQVIEDLRKQDQLNFLLRAMAIQL